MNGFGLPLRPPRTLEEFLRDRFEQDESFVHLGMRLGRQMREHVTPREQAHAGTLVDFVLHDAEAAAMVRSYERSRVNAPGESVRTLVEIQAKRYVLDDHNEIGDPESPECDRCEAAAYSCPTVQALCLPYLSHPHFKPEWRARIELR